MTTSEVSRVSVKAPPFWKENPVIWFKQLESQFIANGITSDITKYHIVVAAIETGVIAQVSDIILNPPSADMYENLKKRLEEQFVDSEERRLKRLLQELELGDRRPSQLLREMRELAGDKVGEQLLRSLWLQRLPTQIQAILSTSTEEVKKLSEMADKIADVTSLQNINAINQEKIYAGDMVVKLQAQVSELTKKLDNSKCRCFHRRNRSVSRGNRTSRPPSTGGERRDICWYHHRFGKKASKCRSPCKFKSENW